MSKIYLKIILCASLFFTSAQEFATYELSSASNDGSSRQKFREYSLDIKSTKNPEYMRKSTAMYSEYHKKRSGKCMGCLYIPSILNLMPSFTSVMDAGCANGKTVRMFLKAGKQAKGIEIYKEPLKHARDLVRKGIIKQQAIIDMDAPTASFDLVFSTDVLEHVPPGDTLLAVCQLVRVAKKYLFIIVGTNEKADRYGDSSSDPWIHEVVKSKDWWLNIFEQFGAKLVPELTMKVNSIVKKPKEGLMILKKTDNMVDNCNNLEGYSFQESK